MSLATWLAQVRQATNMVDAQFGESIFLLPWHKAELYGTGPDTTRPVVGPVTAIFKTTRATAANLAPQIMARFAESDAYISINQEYLDDCDFQQGDRIQLASRKDEEYEANFISHTPFKRSRVFLLKIKEPPT